MTKTIKELKEFRAKFDLVKIAHPALKEIVDLVKANLDQIIKTAEEEYADEHPNY